MEGWNRDWSRALGLAALVGCTGLLVHSFFDFNLQIPANACMFYFLCAVAARTAECGCSRVGASARGYAAHRMSSSQRRSGEHPRIDEIGGHEEMAILGEV